MKTLNLDFETRSKVDLRRAGLHLYAQHPSTEVLCMAWSFGDSEVSLWHPGLPFPSRIADHVAYHEPVRAWNVAFERQVYNHVLSRQLERSALPMILIDQTQDTMAEAAAMALPRSLKWCARALGLEQQKDDVGYRTMLKLSRPGRGGKFYEPTAEELDALYAYCAQDVRTEREIAQKVLRLSKAEYELWKLDQRVNDRGVHIDIPLVKQLQAVVDALADEANDELAGITGEQVGAFTQVQALKAWLLEEHGRDVPSLNKAAVRELLERDDLHPDERRALELRQDLGRTSVGKLQSMCDSTGRDQRARGLLNYHAATTGRWSGNRIQPQNFPRPEVDDPETLIPYVMNGQRVSMPEVTSLLRSCITASPGHRLDVADFSKIEYVVLLWLAGMKPDKLPYQTMTCAIYPEYTDPEEVVKGTPEYQIGKNTVLGCGYQMGWERYKDYVYAATGILPTDELAQKAVDTYRSTHAQVKQLWYDTENAARAAVASPGSRFYTGHADRVSFFRPTKGFASNFLWCQLPSKRLLAYARPAIVMAEAPWGDKVPTLSCMGVDNRGGAGVINRGSSSRQWCRHSLYGGLLVENIVQATARDLLAEAMYRVERAGYPVVLTVHDEVICDVPQDHGSFDEFMDLMQVIPKWAPGLHYEAEGYTAQRWRKD